MQSERNDKTHLSNNHYIIIFVIQLNILQLNFKIKSLKQFTKQDFSLKVYKKSLS